MEEAHFAARETQAPWYQCSWGETAAQGRVLVLYGFQPVGGVVPVDVSNSPEVEAKMFLELKVWLQGRVLTQLAAEVPLSEVVADSDELLSVVTGNEDHGHSQGIRLEDEGWIGGIHLKDEHVFPAGTGPTLESKDLIKLTLIWANINDLPLQVVF